MAYPVPTTIPPTLRAGDTITWRRSLADFPASQGWTISYVLVKSGIQITISATADGADHVIEVPLATSAAWSPGTYAWQERVTKAGKTYTTSAGVLQILASFAAATGGYDARTHAQRTLEALEAWIEGRDIAVSEYQIGDRHLKAIPIPELLILRDRYRREVRAESGAPKSGRVYLRF